MRMINVRVLETKIEKGILEGRALKNAKATLEKIDHRITRVDKWVLENNEGTHGTEIAITKEGHIDLYICIMEKYASKISYIRVGNFQPEFSIGHVSLANGKEVEYKKLGNIINALNKEYEKYGFYFTANTKNNRRILADARKSYELDNAPELAPEPELEKKSGFEVRIVKISTGEVVETIDATNMNMAERIERGVLINLNREDYYVNIVDLSQLKTPEKKERIEITTERKVEKMKEKEMQAINKNGLSNRMVKLGKFIKENRDKNAIENKIFELFPNAMEVQVFDEDEDVVYFLVGQDYVGKAPTKKEMKEINYAFDEIHKMYGLSVHAEIQSEKIEIISTIGVDYSDRYNNFEYTDYTVKTVEIELELTMEMAKEKVEYIREKHTQKTISASTAWDRLKKLTERESADEVTDLLIGELEYFAEEEKKEQIIEYTNDIEVRICEIDTLMQQGTMRKDIAKERFERLFEKAITEELEDIVELAIRYIAVRKDENIVLPEKLQEILDRRYEGVLNRQIEKLEKIKDFSDKNQARKALDRWKNCSETESESGYFFSKEILSVYRGKVNVNDIDASNGVNRVLRGREVVAGVDYQENKKAILYITTRIEYLDNDGVFRTAMVDLYKKEIDLTPDPEKDELDKLIEEYNEISSEIDALNLHQSVGEDCSKVLENKHEKLMKLQQKINRTGDVIVVKHSHRCFMSVPNGTTLFRTQEEVDAFEKRTENTLEIQKVFTVEKKEKLDLGSNLEPKNSEVGETPSCVMCGNGNNLILNDDATEFTCTNCLSKEDMFKKEIKEHINAVLDLSTRENNGVGYIYKKTIAVKKESGYELTTMFEDMCTGMPVYIGNSGNMVFISNSEKSFLTDKIEGLLNNKVSINECVTLIKEKIKRKFEYTYSKSESIIESQSVFVLSYAGDMEVFWSYDDAYEKMVKLAKETAEERSYGHKLIIEDYSARVDVLTWNISQKNIQ